ncbi:MAG: aldose epimerase family protein [Sphingomonadales bacterium]|jgi:aldose 1-epimerase
MAITPPPGGGRRIPFGHVPGEGEAELLTLANASGMRVEILTLGAAIHAVWVPDRRGAFANVTLCYPDLAGYRADTACLGASIGRVAGRIAGGRFVLDGRLHQLPRNDGANSLHGGSHGFHRRLWQVGEASASAVTLHLVSRDGDQGFPGTLSVSARYRLDDAGRLSLTYTATTDAPTVVGLTNHAYWNLAGDGDSVLGHMLTILSDAFLPSDAALIPTGEIRAVAGTPFDFRTPTLIGARITADDEQLRLAGGYDHNWLLARTGQPALAAVLHDPASGRTLRLFTDQPGLQMYSANGLGGQGFARYAAITLEPQYWPDTPNRPAFGSARLAPGETYRNRIVMEFGVD